MRKDIQRGLIHSHGWREDILPEDISGAQTSEEHWLGTWPGRRPQSKKAEDLTGGAEGQGRGAGGASPEWEGEHAEWGQGPVGSSWVP